MTHNCINFENNTLLEAKTESVFIRKGLSNSCWLNAKALLVGIVNFMTFFLRGELNRRCSKLSIFIGRIFCTHAKTHVNLSILSAD